MLKADARVRHAFRESSDYPALMDASNAVASASLGCTRALRADEGPDLLCVAEDARGRPVAAVHFAYAWDKESWEIGTVCYASPLTDQVIILLKRHVFWCLFRNPRLARLAKSSPNMVQSILA